MAGERASEDVAFTAGLENKQAIDALIEMRAQIIEVGKTGTTMTTKLRDDMISQLDKMSARLVKFYADQKAQGGVVTENQVKENRKTLSNFRRMLKAMQEEIDRNAPKIKVDVIPPEQGVVSTVKFDEGTRGIGGFASEKLPAITREQIAQLKEQLIIERDLAKVHDQTITTLRRLEAQGGTTYDEAIEDIKTLRLVLQSSVDAFLNQEKGAKSFSAVKSEISSTRQELNRYNREFEESVKEAGREPIAVQNLNAAWDQVLIKIKQLRSIGTADANKRADAYETWATSIKSVATGANKTSAELKKHETELKNIATGAQKSYENLKAMQVVIDKLKPIDDKIQLRRIQQTSDRVTKGLTDGMNSVDQEVKDIATDLNVVQQRSSSAFAAGKTSADQYEKELEGVERRLNSIGVRTRDTADRTEKAWSGSAYKIGYAMDRMGSRSVGSIIRIYDAFKGLTPAMIGAGLAVAGITIAFSKLLEVAQEVLKKISQAVVQLAKDSLEASKDVEIIDKQFASLFSNIGSESERLGKVMREHLLGESFRLGFDLTEDFAQVVVPISESVEQVDQLAEQAAILTHVFGRTEEAIANAIKQATGGHFRPLIQQFGFTETEIQAIQRYQEEFGELEGVLRGMQDFTRRRGLTFDSISDSLTVLEGKAKVARKQLEILIGDPIRMTVEEQIGSLFDSLADNSGAVEQLASGLGEAIAGIIETVGKHINALVNSITDDDVEKIRGGFDKIATGLNNIITSLGSLTDEDFTTIADGFDDIAEAVQGVANAAADLIELHRILTDMRDTVDTLGGTLDEESTGIIGYLKNVSNFTDEFVAVLEVINNIGEMIRTVLDGGTVSLEKFREQFGFLVDSIPVVGDILDFLGLSDDVQRAIVGATTESTEATKKFTKAELEAADALTDSWQAKNDLIDVDQKLIDQSLALTSAEREYADAVEEAADADKEIYEARLEFATEYNQKRLDLAKEQARKELDIEIEKSRKLLDIERKRADAFDDLNARFGRDRADAATDAFRKEEDIERNYNRKLEDIERERGRKRIDIEEKLQEQLRQLRTKYLDQLEEAARRNDAVSFLRIQRNMKRDIEEAKRSADQQRKEADNVEQQKREDAKIWLDRQVEDANIAEGRKIADLIHAAAIKEQEIKKQYRRELALLEEWEKRKMEDLATWRSQANDDLAEWHDQELQKLDKRLEDQYALVEDRTEKFLAFMNAKLQSAMSVSSQISSVVAQAIATASQMSLQAGFPVGQGFNLGNWLNLQSQINPLTMLPSEIQAIQQFGIGGFIGDNRQFGGHTPPGSYMVGETRPEAFRSTTAGIIDPNPFMFSPSNLSNSTVIDNSSRVNANIGLTDPTQVDPITLTQWRIAITEQILSARYGG